MDIIVWKLVTLINDDTCEALVNDYKFRRNDVQSDGPYHIITSLEQAKKDAALTPYAFIGRFVIPAVDGNVSWTRKTGTKTGTCQHIKFVGYEHNFVTGEYQRMSLNVSNILLGFLLDKKRSLISSRKKIPAKKYDASGNHICVRCEKPVKRNGSRYCLNCSSTRRYWSDKNNKA